MTEASTVPGFDQVMGRKAYIENYMAALGQRYHSHYLAGWVNLTDAQFLYWIVRRLKPKTILQTGVSQRPVQRLHDAGAGQERNADGSSPRRRRAGDTRIPPIRIGRANGAVFGFVIPEGKSSGWMVPDIYRDRFEVRDRRRQGACCRQLVDRLPARSTCYPSPTSDHSYNHMMFEFEQAKRKLAPNGVVVADDISWNAPLWDFRRQIPTCRATITAARWGLRSFPGGSEIHGRDASSVPQALLYFVVAEELALPAET